MSVKLTFIASNRNGNFGNIVLALTQMGYKPSNFKLDKSADSPLESIQMQLKAVQKIESGILRSIQQQVPTIVDIQVDPI